MDSKLKGSLRLTVASASLVLAVLFALCPVSCRSASEGLQVLSGDFSVPSLLSCTLTDAEHVELVFSKPVQARAFYLSERDGEDVRALPVHAETEGPCETVVVSSGDALGVGQSFVLSGEIADRSGNTLTFSVPFSGFNDRVPALVISEVRNNWKNGDGRAEYVELYALTGGNLSGITFENAYKAGKRKYTLPSAEVSAGEYIVLHLQTITDGDEVYPGLFDETGDDLSLATVRSDECLSSARDLWLPYTEKILGSTDIIVLRDMNCGGRILDAVCYRTDGKEGQWGAWYDALSREVEASGVWRDAEGNAVCTLESCADMTALKTAATKSLSRRGVQALSPDGIHASSADWAVTGTKGYTPGARNSL